jgi:cytochrome b6-f complex iron-sulfur subunit
METNATEPESKDHEKCGGCTGNGKCHDNDEGLERGDFLKISLAVVAMLWGGMTLYPIYRYLTPKKGDADEKTKVTSLEVCKVSELPPGSGKNFRFGSAPALLIHTKDGQFHAFKAICTHLGCTVQYQEAKDNIFCACHGGVYDAATGKNIAGPPPKPLSALKAEVVKDKIVVSIV